MYFLLRVAHRLESDVLALGAELVELACVAKVEFFVTELLLEEEAGEEELVFEEVTPALVFVLKGVAEELGFCVLETAGEDEEAMLEAIFEAELALMLDVGAELEAELLLSVPEVLAGAEAALELAF